MTTPTLEGVLEELVTRRLREVHTSIPGQIEAYDQARQRATVQPLIRTSFIDEEGVRQTALPPVIENVPVVFPGSGADYSDTWPLRRGDTVWLEFSEASLDKWLQQGGKVDPRDDRRFNLSDAVAFPGLRDFAHPVPAAGVHSTARVIRAPLLHACGDQSLALKSELVALKNAIANAATGDAIPGAVAGVSITGTTKLKGA